MAKIAGILQAHLFNRKARREPDEHGILTQADVSLWTEVPKGAGPPCDPAVIDCSHYVSYASGEYALVVLVMQQVTRFRPYQDDNETGHPTYLIIKPAGCEICLGINAQYHPTADRKVVERLLNINFSCITRWKPCTEEKDIVPDMWMEYVAERRQQR